MGRFLDLLERAWHWRAPPKWIAFFFLAETILGLLVILTITYPTYTRDERSLFFVVANLILLYIWLVVTGRTVLRLKTFNESNHDLPRALLAISSVVYLISASMMTAGNKGLEDQTGNTNSFSEIFMTITPFTIICGLFNLTLCMSRAPSRLLSASVAVANAALAIGVIISCEATGMFMSYGGRQAGLFGYGRDQDFPQALLGEEYPLEPLTAFHTLRMLPVPILLNFSATTAVMTLSAVVKVGMAETAIKQFRSRSRSLPAAALGVVMLVLSIILTSRVSFMSSLSYFYWDNLVVVAVASLGATSCGLGAIAMVAKSNKAMKVAVMILAAGTFFTSYNSFYYTSSFEKSVEYNYNKMIDSRCTAGGNDGSGSGSNRWYDYTTDTTTTSTVETTPTFDTLEPAKACFGSKNNGVICIELNKLCDGIIDIVDAVDHFCDPSGNREDFYGLREHPDKSAFTDELHCPSMLAVTFTTLRALGWAGLVTSVALILVLGLGAGRQVDHEETEEENAMSRRVRNALAGMVNKGMVWKGEEEGGKLDEEEATPEVGRRRSSSHQADDSRC